MTTEWQRLIREIPSSAYQAGFDDGFADRTPPDEICEEYRLGYNDGQFALFGDESEDDGEGWDEEEAPF